MSKVDASTEEKVTDSVDAARDENTNVAKSYTFDIKVLDAEGNELQPDTDKGQVRVSFATAEVTNENLEVEVYHISDEILNDDTKSAEKLDSNVETVEGAEVVVAETTGFSYYTVEFTYNNLQYVMNGDTRIPLADILKEVGLTGTLTNAVSSNPKLFSVAETDDVWMVTANQAFTSNEWLKVTIDGVEYEIIVTDAVIGSVIDNDTNDLGTHLKDSNGIWYTINDGEITVTVGAYQKNDEENNENHNSLGIAYQNASIANVIIPEKIQYNGTDYTVVAIGYKAFAAQSQPSGNQLGGAWGSSYANTTLTSVSIPSTVTKINYSAFYNCTALTSVTMPNVVTIGDQAFASNTALTSVTMPNAVTIKRLAFNKCSALTSISMRNIETIGYQAFNRCSQLRKVDLSTCTNLKTIEDSAFARCTNLSEVVFPKTCKLTKLSQYSFARTGLTTVTVPEYVTTIEGGVFRSNNLQTVYILGDTVKSFVPTKDTNSEWAFDQCTDTASWAIGGVKVYVPCELVEFYATTSAVRDGKEKSWKAYASNNLYMVHDHSLPNGQGGKAATCTEPGYTSGYYCSTENKVYANGTVTSMTTPFSTTVKTNNITKYGANTITTTPVLGHQWTYTANGNVVTATCNRTANPCEYHTNGLPYILTADDMDYTGDAYPSSKISAKNNITPVITTASASTVTYYTNAACTTKTTNANSGAASEGAAPKNAGTYYAQATIGGKSAVDEFTINKVEASVTAPTEKDLTYNGTDQALVDAGSVAGGAGTMYYRVNNGDWSTAIPTAKNVKYDGTSVTSYKVDYYVQGDQNHSDKGSVENPIGSVNVTISPKEVSRDMISFDFESKSYADGAEITQTATFKDGTRTLSTENDITVTGDALKQTAVGTYTVTIQGKGNYTNKVSKTWTVVGKDFASGDYVVKNEYEATYDGAYHGATITPASGKTFSDFKVVYSDREDGDYSETSPANSKKNAGTYTVWYKVIARGYNETQPASTKITIEPKSITVSGIKADTKTYDGTTAASLDVSEASFDGKLANDTVHVTVPNGVRAAFADKNVGKDKQVAITTGALALDNANYTLSAQPTGIVGEITKKDMHVTATATDRAYDGSNTVTVKGSLVTSDLCTGDQLSVSDTTGTMEDATVGANKSVTTAFALTGTDNDNYRLIQPTNVKVTISQKEIKVDWSEQALTYNGNAQKPSAKLSGVEDLDKARVSVSVAGEKKDAGTYTATASLTGDAKENYRISTETLEKEFTIEPKEATLSFAPLTFTYDKMAHVPTGSVTNLVKDDACTVTVDQADAKTYAGTDYTVTATGLNNGNYKLPKNPSAAYTILKADPELSVSAVADQTYGGSDFTLDVHRTGESTPTFASSDAEVVNVDENTGEVTLVGAGTATITVTMAESANYNKKTATIEITVKKKNASLVVANATYDVTYGDADFTIDGFTREGESDTVFTSSDESVATVDKTGKVSIRKAGETTITLSMKESANYKAVETKVTVKVAPKPITVTASDKQKTYGEADPAFGYRVSEDGLVGNDKLTGILASRVAGENVGSYEITATQKEGVNGNYAITFEKGTLTIEPKNIDGATVTLGSRLTANGSAQAQGVDAVEIDGMAATFTVSDNNVTKAGKYTMKITGTGNFTGTIENTFVVVDPENPADQGNVKVDVVVDPKAPETVMATPKGELMNLVMTADEAAAVADGAELNIWLEVNDATETITETSKEQIAAGTSGYTIGNYIDISLFKKLSTENEKTQITGTAKAVQIAVAIPKDLLNQNPDKTRTYAIVRNHEGKVEILPTSFDAQTGTLTFETNQFSDYAILYKDVDNLKAVPVQPTAQQSQNPLVPNTGDNSHAGVWMLLLLLGFAGIIGAAAYKRKLRIS